MGDTFCVGENVFGTMNAPLCVIHNPVSSQKLVTVKSIKMLYNQWVANTYGAVVSYRMTSPVVGNNPSFQLTPLDTGAPAVSSKISVTCGLDGGTGVGGSGVRFRSQLQCNPSYAVGSAAQTGPISGRYCCASRRKRGGQNINNGEVFVFANSAVEPIVLQENQAFVISNPADAITSPYPFWYAVTGIIKIGSNCYSFCGNVALAQATRWPFFAIVNETGSGSTVQICELNFNLIGDTGLAYHLSGPWVRLQRGGLYTGGVLSTPTPFNSAKTATFEMSVSKQHSHIELKPWLNTIDDELLNPHGGGWQNGVFFFTSSTTVNWHFLSTRPGLLRHMLWMPQISYNTSVLPACLYFQQGAKFSEIFSSPIELYPGESVALVPDYNCALSGYSIHATVIEDPLPARNQNGTYAFIG